ncbi:ABC transporter permease [Lentisphaerota bacterium ZTH]|nr:ABC transporter permease [Lentisphaerota bacterium]WET07257.1 ABC transporter permease [Lentisphaerota bacterium ZTH]
MLRLIYIREIGVIFSLLLLFIIFSIIAPGFCSIMTFGGIFSTSSELGIVALGVTILMIAGEFDLSVGANFAFSGMVFAYFINNSSFNSFLVLALVLAAALLIGLLNGLLTVYLRIPSFIVTLGTMMFWRGMVLLFTSGIPISVMKSCSVMTLFSPDSDYSFIAGLFLWIIIAVTCGCILNRTALGNRIMATGGNKDTAFAAGINTNMIKLLAFAVCGMLAGLGGILQFCHLSSFLPTAGQGYELSAIAAAVIGGTVLSGGTGTFIGTMLGVLMINMISSGIVQAGASTYWYQSIVGVIVIVAVAVNTFISGRFTGRKGVSHV